jgi:excisionase family DNA binding protein
VLEELGTAAQSPYLSVTEAAEYLRCSPQRIYDLLSSRRLSKLKDGSRVLLLRAELDEHIQGVARLLPPGQEPRTRRATAA